MPEGIGQDSQRLCRYRPGQEKCLVSVARSAKLLVRSTVGLRDNGIVGCTGRRNTNKASILYKICKNNIYCP